MNIWIFQSGEFIHTDTSLSRPMRAVNLSNYFIKSYHNVTLWSSAFSHQEKKHRTKIFKSEIFNKKLKINLVPSPGYKSNISIQRLYDHFILSINTLRWILKTPNSFFPDFVFIGYPPIETSFFLSLLFKLLKIPFCIDIKDQWPNIFLFKFKGIKRNLVRVILHPYFLAASISLKLASFLTSISPSFLKWAEVFSKNFNNYNRVLYLSPEQNSISQIDFNEANLWWKEKIGIDIEKKNKLIFAGNINNAFDFSNLIYALNSKKLNKYDFEVIICGEGEKKEELYNKLSHLKNVYFPGWVDLKHLITLKEISVGYLAPYSNTIDFQMSIPNKIIDSLYFGLPILTGLRGEVENLIQTYKIGYFCENKNSWIKNISFCLSDKQMRDKFSRNGKILFKKDFNPDLVYGNFVKFIEENFKK